MPVIKHYELNYLDHLQLCIVHRSWMWRMQLGTPTTPTTAPTSSSPVRQDTSSLTGTERRPSNVLSTKHGQIILIRVKVTCVPDHCVCTRSLCVQLVQSAELVMKVTHCNRQTLAFVFQETLSPTCFIQYIALVYPDNLHKIIWQKNNF